MLKQKGKSGIVIGYCLIIILLISITGVSASVWAEPYNSPSRTSLISDTTKTMIVTNDADRVFAESELVDTLAINADFLQEMRKNGELLSTDEFASRITDYYNTLVAVLTALFVLFTIVTYLTIRSKFERKFEDKAKELEDNQRKKIVEELKSMLSDSKKIDEVIKSAIGGRIDDSMATKEEVDGIANDIVTFNSKFTPLSKDVADIKAKQSELYSVVSDLQEHISSNTLVFELVDDKMDGEVVSAADDKTPSSTGTVTEPDKTEI